MKPVAFDYARPRGLGEALELLNQGEGRAKALAGGQSLGPMLNLRLVQPELLVDITGIPELTRSEEAGDGLTLGACVSHAVIEDKLVPDVTRGVLPAVAYGIAYRAVRSRGTIGGSLVHADPSADWISALSALGATALIAGPGGRREVPVAELMVGVFETLVGSGELLEAVRIPRLSSRARWGYYKICRKTGEFAHAIGAFLHDPEGGRCRAVVGATEAAPLVVEEAAGLFGGKLEGEDLAERLDASAVERLMTERGLERGPQERQLHLAALRRAVAQAVRR